MGRQSQTRAGNADPIQSIQDEQHRARLNLKSMLRGSRIPRREFALVPSESGSWKQHGRNRCADIDMICALSTINPRGKYLTRQRGRCKRLRNEIGLKLKIPAASHAPRPAPPRPPSSPTWRKERRGVGGGSTAIVGDTPARWRAMKLAQSRLKRMKTPLECEGQFSIKNKKSINPIRERAHAPSP